MDPEAKINKVNDIEKKEEKQNKRGWVDDPGFTLEALVSGDVLVSTMYYKTSSVTFRSISAAQVQAIGDKYDLIGFGANRDFNCELLAVSIVKFNDKPLKGNTIQEKMETLKNYPDPVFDLLLNLHQMFRRKIQDLITEESINVF